FIAGTIEYNVIKDTIGYNAEIKHQNPRPRIAGIPTNRNSTVIRHNVFSKSGSSSGGAKARPNLLVGHWPLSGPGADDLYEIYGNFFYENPVEALFQGEGNIAFHHNLLVNDFGMAVNIQRHNDVPRAIRIFHNTVVARDVGVRESGGSPKYRQIVIGNAVFAGMPIQASDARQNATDTYASAVKYLLKPFGPLGELDLFPHAGALVGTAVDTGTIDGASDWKNDFNGVSQDEHQRGAYSGGGANPGWLPNLAMKPRRAEGPSRAP